MAIANQTIVTGPLQGHIRGHDAAGWCDASYYISEVQFDIVAPLVSTEPIGPLLPIAMNANFNGGTPALICWGIGDGGNATLANGAGQGLTLVLMGEGTHMQFRNGVTGALDTPAATANLRISLVVSC